MKPDKRRTGWSIGHQRVTHTDGRADHGWWLAVAELDLPPIAGGFENWPPNLRQAVLSDIADFVAARCAADLDAAGVEVAGDVLMDFVSGGKCLRSTFMCLGWLCGAAPSAAAVRAAASLELLHAFALLQDDVMDASTLRRGRPAAHVQFTRWHRQRALCGSARRFGESAAILLGDLCLIWSEQILRESGVEHHRLQQAWPRYDAMRIELAVGHSPISQPTSGICRRWIPCWTWRAASQAITRCDVRWKSARRWPVATTHPVAARPLWRRPRRSVPAARRHAGRLRIADYDGQAGWCRPPRTQAHQRGGGRHQMADATTRRQLVELMNSDSLDDSAVERWRALIVVTGAAQRIEDMIAARTTMAHNQLGEIRVDESVRAALTGMATVCTERAA